VADESWLAVPVLMALPAASKLATDDELLARQSRARDSIDLVIDEPRAATRQR
jgi:hypothetical protein